MVFGPHTTSAEVAAEFKNFIVGKHFVVTGGNSGIGKETARVLTKEGGIVTICCRTVSKGEAAKAEILQETPAAQIQILQLDLNSLKSVKECANALAAAIPPLNVLINNAGIMAPPKTITENGFESQFQSNHLGHYYLTKLLIPTLHASGTPEGRSRVINVSSVGNIILPPKHGIDFDDIAATKSYNAWSRYGQSKLAQISSAFYFQSHIGRSHNITFVSLHPGTIPDSNLNNKQNDGTAFWRTLEFATSLKYWNLRRENLVNKTLAEGAATTLVCASDPGVEGGQYYSDCQISNQLHALAFDERFSQKVVEVSDRLIAESGF
ncbi:hypothetical protein HK100_003268 [Physocladia obscura]|uniref:Short-chain dehydrogenase n=1 Tax=Physocladia obscura TaxID=109957 RepID=A0AAD5SWX0_9FUNG|nr:hypothetical protein HK100_003268 [Physocladia obscura]